MAIRINDQSIQSTFNFFHITNPSGLALAQANVVGGTQTFFTQGSTGNTANYYANMQSSGLSGFQGWGFQSREAGSTCVELCPALVDTDDRYGFTALQLGISSDWTNWPYSGSMVGAALIGFTSVSAVSGLEVDATIYYNEGSEVFRSSADFGDENALLLNRTTRIPGPNSSYFAGTQINSYISTSPCAYAFFQNPTSATPQALIWFRRYFNGWNNVGYVTIATNSVALTNLSDHRLKTDVEPVTGALDVIDRLRPISYHARDSDDTAETQGFIAHELQEVIPEAVSGQRDEVDHKGNPRYQMVSMAPIVPWLTAALKELADQVKNLNAELTQLEARP